MNRKMNVIDGVIALYNTILLYLNACFTLMTPGTIIWKLFGTRKGKVALISRDLICDSETLINLPKCSKPLDGYTNALCPFLPTFLLDNDQYWKQRREVFSYGNNLLLQRLLQKNIQLKLQSQQGNILWEMFEILSKFSFEILFNRTPTDEEFEDIYPGLIDVNRIIKRFTSNPDLKVRDKLYQRTLKLITENEKDFLFHNYSNFFEMSELHQVSSVAEDFLITISVQCTDLICHMLLLYSEYHQSFDEDLDNSINETLRLYPLTDLWTREAYGNERGWITSLVQLNRNGWTQPDIFFPERWKSSEHPPLMSWGFDQRRCPAQKLATNISKLIFQNLIENEGFWIVLANNFEHERTFPYGCQVSIGYGEQPSHIKYWTFPRKFQMKFRRWACEKLRMINQNELN